MRCKIAFQFVEDRIYDVLIGVDVSQMEEPERLLRQMFWRAERLLRSDGP